MKIFSSSSRVHSLQAGSHDFKLSPTKEMKKGKKDERKE
jgi:hypothetical protein